MKTSVVVVVVALLACGRDRKDQRTAQSSDPKVAAQSSDPEVAVEPASPRPAPFGGDSMTKEQRRKEIVRGVPEMAGAVLVDADGEVARDTLVIAARTRCTREALVGIRDGFARMTFELASAFTEVRCSSGATLKLERKPRITDIDRASNIDATRFKVTQYVIEGFSQWATAHPNKACPDKLIELNAYTNGDDGNINDAWGRPIKMKCGTRLPPGATDIAVSSMGEDGKEGTEDDIKSWE